MENLEEIAVGGRVTRSLRKRLTSIDSSDAGSRPNTPIPTKLTAIPELKSPSRSTRMSRRNSTTGVSTPVKTPAKSKAATIAESNDSLATPKRRSTRKRSDSTTEESTIKSSQMTIAQPKFEHLTEERHDEQNTVTKRVTRLQSKSPSQPAKENELQSKSPVEEKNISRHGETKGSAKIKPGPKSRSRRSTLISKSDTDESDAEVIILEDDDEDENMEALVSAKKPIDEKNKTPTRSSLNSSDKQNASAIKCGELIDLVDESMISHEELKNNDMTKNETEWNETKQSNKTLEDSLEAPNEKENNKTETSVETSTKEKVCVRSVVRLEKLSPEAICRLTCKENIDTSPVTINRSRNLKYVAFNEIDGEIEKNVYPKTPRLAKSKSYIDTDYSNERHDKSYQSEKETTNTSKDSSDNVRSVHTKLNNSKESDEYHDAKNDLDEANEFDILRENTPHKSTLMYTMQSSTPVIESISKLASERIVSKMESLVEENTENYKQETPEKLPQVNNEPPVSNLENSLVEKSSNGEFDVKRVESEVEELNDEKSNGFKTSKLEISTTLNNIDLAVTEEVGEKINETLHSLSAKPNEIVSSKLENSKTLNIGDLEITKEWSKENDEASNSPLSKSWTQNISGRASSVGKIDTIASLSASEQENSIIGKAHLPTEDSQPSESANKSMKLNKSGEVSDDEEDLLNGKCEMIDDEAIEASEDYESGDSLDEEERKEMEDNEIQDNGESLGSEDTDRSAEEEDVEENASFVTSDSEEMLLEYSDVDGSSENKSNNIQKNRVFNVASNSESDPESNHDLGQALTLDVTKMIDETVNDGALVELVDKEHTKKSPNKYQSTQNDENSVIQENEMLNESGSQSPASQNKANEESVPFREVSLSASEKRLLNSSNGGKTRRRHLLKMKNRAIETSDSDDEEQNGLSICQSIRVRRAQIYESSNEDSDSDEAVDGSQHVKQMCAKSQAQNTDTEVGKNTAVAHKNEENDSGEEIAVSQHIKRMSVKSKAQIIGTEFNDKTVDSHKSEDVFDFTDGSENASATKTNAAAHDKENVNISKLKITSDAKPINNRDMLNDTISSKVDNGSDSEGDIVIPETQAVDESSFEEAESHVAVGSKKESVEESDEEDTVDLPLKCISKASGLSKSCSQHKVNKDTVVRERVMHNSFKIGVTVTNNVHQVSAYKLNSDYNENDQINDENSDEHDMPANISVSDKKMILSSDEEQELEKLSKAESQTDAFKLVEQKRHSLAVPSSSISNTSSTKTLKRKSMHISGAKFDPSKSLIESIEDRKRELHEETATKKRLSKSLCNATEDPLPSSEAKKEATNVDFIENATKISKQEESQSILERCDEILDAANRAKLEAKLNYKKSKLVMPKDKKRINLKNKNAEESFIPKHTKKEMKQAKDKTKLALKQAIRASAKILLNEPDRKTNLSALSQAIESKWEQKRLPMQLLDAVSSSETKTGKDAFRHNKAEDDSSHTIIQHIKSTSGDIIEEALTPPRKKKTFIKQFELPTGIVIEEPVTPKKEKIVSGFRVSPVTPRTIGFKVRHILTAGQDTPPTLSRAERKRKARIAEPTHTLPKPQWSQSGMFIEEELTNTRTISKAGATEFLVAGLNETGKHKHAKKLAAGTAAANALHFKNTIMNRGNHPRETTHEALLRKARQLAQKHF